MHIELKNLNKQLDQTKQTRSISSQQQPRTYKKSFLIDISMQKPILKCWTSQHKQRSTKNSPNKPGEHIWNESASSLLRDHSPSHRIPRAQRFSSVQKDLERNGLYGTLNLSKDLNRGCKFPQSKRINHFVHRDRKNSPSPISYQKPRFLDNSKYKIKKTKKSFSISHGLDITSINNEQTTDTYHYKTHAYGTNLQKQRAKSELRGRTISQFDKYHKLFLDHGKNIPYQTQFFQGNPGVGSYNVEQSYNKAIAKDKKKYSMRKILQRFNQTTELNLPGPATYIKEDCDILKEKFCTKQTIQRINPNNGVPGVGKYNIQRFLQ